MINQIDTSSNECPKQLIDKVSTPCYLISQDVIEANCRILADIQKRTGAKILLALKAFALPEIFSIIKEHLHGVCASGPIEAQLGYEEFGKEVHTYAPAYTNEQIKRVLLYSDHIVFNSISQWNAHKDVILKSPEKVCLGLRINPEYSEIQTDLYNPCVVGSRFGIRAVDLEGVELEGISGVHFHAMCEQGADVLDRVLENVENKFGDVLRDERIKWVNFGGGHYITKEGYDVDLLCRLIENFRSRYNVSVYLEPGEAVVLNGGFYVTTVLDVIENGIKIGIVDGSAETHLPDVLAMPYRPYIPSSAFAGEKKYTYRLGGISCLAGDIIGDYSFDAKLTVGQKLCLTDMALYSFVKNTTFNGVELPTIYRYSLQNNSVDIVREYGYEDYKSRIAKWGFI